MLRNLPIKKKGLFIVSAPLVLFVLLLATLYGFGASLDRALARTVHSQAVLDKLEAAGGELVAIHGENLQLALLGSSESSSELGTRRDAVRAAARELQAMTADDDHQSRIVAQFVPLAEELLVDLAETQRQLRLALAADEPTRTSRADARTRVAADGRKLQRVLTLSDDLERRERALSVERLERTNRLGRDQRWALLVGGALTLTIALSVGGWAMASMVRRLLLVRDNVARLGDDAELRPLQAGGDEIGLIDRAVHDMVRSLRAQRRDNEMFIYSVSHDLRSPLVNLQGFGNELAGAAVALRAAVAADGVPDELRTRVLGILERDVEVALHYIDLAVQRQARIIDSLLRLSRAGRVEYEWRIVALRPIVEGIVAGLRQQEDLVGAEFVVDDLPLVMGDAAALERVFDNLIANAVKYRAPERPLRLEIGGAAADAGFVRLSVRDNGVGIAPELQDRVFLPFARFAGGEGEGIGLSLARRVVDRLHGRIWLTSEPGVGTTVHLELRAVGSGETR